MPTIVAIATPPGNGGVGIIRLSGPGAKALLARAFLPKRRGFENFRPYMLHRGILLNTRDLPLDDVLAVYMPGPNSYTGEDVAEVHCHGGALLVQEALESFLRLGARLAEPGEFTRRAFLNGRMDISQAEAVAELIAAPSREALAHSLGRLEGRLSREVARLGEQVDQLRAWGAAAVDFPEEELEAGAVEEVATRAEGVMGQISALLRGAERGRLMGQGARVVLVGPVNVGKSSLLNALCGEDRALVSPLPGTTRDFIEVQLDLDGLPVRLMDSAGLRPGGDLVERMGMERTRRLLEDADLAVVMLDASQPVGPWQPDGLDLAKAMLVWNKIDVAPAPSAPPWARDMPLCAISALTGSNVDELARLWRQLLLAPHGEALGDGQPSPNVRQSQALRDAGQCLGAFASDVRSGVPYDCCLSHLDMAMERLGSVVALAPDDELLDLIFSQFCIGK